MDGGTIYRTSGAQADGSANMSMYVYVYRYIRIDVCSHMCVDEHVAMDDHFGIIQKGLVNKSQVSHEDVVGIFVVMVGHSKGCCIVE